MSQNTINKFLIAAATILAPLSAVAGECGLEAMPSNWKITVIGAPNSEIRKAVLEDGGNVKPEFPCNIHHESEASLGFSCITLEGFVEGRIFSHSNTGLGTVAYYGSSRGFNRSAFTCKRVDSESPLICLPGGPK